MRRAVVNVAIGGNYAAVGQPRLAQSLDNFGSKADKLFWTNVPPCGCPEDCCSSRIFKPYAMREAWRQGYDQILWLDASAYLKRSIDPIWEWINQHGCYLGHWANYIADVASPKALETMGCTMEEARKIPLVLGGCVGFDLGTKIGRALMDTWWLAMKAGVFDDKDGRDETPLSVAAWRWGIPCCPHPGMFTGWDVQNDHRVIEFCGV